MKAAPLTVIGQPSLLIYLETRPRTRSTAELRFKRGDARPLRTFWPRQGGPASSTALTSCVGSPRGGRCPALGCDPDRNAYLRGDGRIDVGSHGIGVQRDE